MNKIMCWWKWRTKDRGRAENLMEAVSAKALGYMLTKTTHSTTVNRLMNRCDKHYKWLLRVYEGKLPFTGGAK